MARIDNDSKKIKLLINKVKALADKGEGGEKETAKKKLSELLTKYNIKKFEESKYKKRSFKLANFDDCRTIMVHCILDTKPDVSIEGSKQKKELYCKLTDEQYIDVCQKFNHYYPEFHRQHEAFVMAFIIKNDLGIVKGDDNSNLDDNDIESVKEMISSVSENRYKKQNLMALNSN
jgi:hypothetical protein